MRPIFNRTLAGICSVLTLFACDSPMSERERGEAAREALTLFQIEQRLPVVSSKETYRRALNLYKSACLQNIEDFSKAANIFSASGMRQISSGKYQPDIIGYVVDTPRNREMIAPSALNLALAMRREDGRIPLITKFQSVGDQVNRVFSDGIMFASVRTGKKNNDSCAVELKTPDDSALLAEFQRVVEEASLAKGPPRENGLLGTGYQIGKIYLTLGREYRSSQSPTTISAIDFDRK